MGTRTEKTPGNDPQNYKKVLKTKPQQPTFYEMSDDFRISLESNIIKILWAYGLGSHQLSLTGLAECAKRLNKETPFRQTHMPFEMI